jgi:hypothetical protein
VTASWGITVTVYPRNMSRVSSMGWGWSGVVVTRLATTENFPLLLLRGKEVMPSRPPSRMNELLDERTFVQGVMGGTAEEFGL